MAAVDEAPDPAGQVGLNSVDPVRVGQPEGACGRQVDDVGWHGCKHGGARRPAPEEEDSRHRWEEVAAEVRHPCNGHEGARGAEGEQGPGEPCGGPALHRLQSPHVHERPEGVGCQDLRAVEADGRCQGAAGGYAFQKWPGAIPPQRSQEDCPPRLCIRYPEEPGCHADSVYGEDFPRQHQGRQPEAAREPVRGEDPEPHAGRELGEHTVNDVRLRQLHAPWPYAETPPQALALAARQPEAQAPEPEHVQWECGSHSRWPNGSHSNRSIPAR
mmetsp:Transcript_23263/g.72477  ORF Transcript_23263/g.72477 Transcript_23263/m.72477 type:complete len:272 (-) Transcript_23263:580-1395(-)